MVPLVHLVFFMVASFCRDGQKNLNVKNRGAQLGYAPDIGVRQSLKTITINLNTFSLEIMRCFVHIAGLQTFGMQFDRLVCSFLKSSNFI